MKFAYKLSMAITILLAVSLSVGGYLFVRQNFLDSLAVAVEHNTNQHVLEKYSLESELFDIDASDEEYRDRNLKRYGTMMSEYLGSVPRWIGLFDEGKTEIYSNFNETLPLEDRVIVLQEEKYYIRHVGKETLMLIASPIESKSGTVWLLNGYSITSLFTERERQAQTYFRMELLILAGAMIVVVILSTRLTKPIRKLNIVSRKIAAGAYSVRTMVKTDDEIGELGKNFDKMALAVEQKVEALNVSLHQRDDFVGAFTHEIKTPMTSIIGYSDILRSAEHEPHVRQKAANYIYYEAKRLESLSQKLLLLMGLAEQELHKEPVQLNTLFAMVGRSVLMLLDGIKLDFTPAGDLFVLAEIDLVCDLLRNLVLNAAKSNPQDNMVHIGWHKVNGKVCVWVKDKGCGMDERELERIKEPFYMVDKSRARAEGGSGLGLALCEKIANLHGTTLHFESELGKGTCVSILLDPWESGEKRDETL